MHIYIYKYIYYIYSVRPLRSHDVTCYKFRCRYTAYSCDHMWTSHRWMAPVLLTPKGPTVRRFSVDHPIQQRKDRTNRIEHLPQINRTIIVNTICICINMYKSAHTALAVKACLLGGNSNTKCSMTFVNIAVAISALAGGGQKRFRTETRIRWCFRHFLRIFGCLSARGYWNGILGHFGSFPAMEKRPKMKKTLYIARFCRVFGCQSIENTAKTSVLDWRYSKKRVNYRMLDWKHYKNTVKSVKSNVLEGFTAFIAKNV